MSLSPPSLKAIFFKRTAEDIIEIGKDLIAIKEELPHGRFLPWVASEFEMSWDTANRFISVASRLNDIPQIAEFQTKRSVCTMVHI